MNLKNPVGRWQRIWILCAYYRKDVFPKRLVNLERSSKHLTANLFITVNGRDSKYRFSPLKFNYSCDRNTLM